MNPLLNFVNDPMTVLGLNVLNSNNRPAQGLLQGLNQNTALAQNRANLLQDELQRQQMQAQIIRNQQIEDARRRYFQPSVAPQEALYGLGSAGDIPGASLQAQMLPKPTTPPSIVQTASYLYTPGSKEWTQFIHDATLKPLVQMGDKIPPPSETTYFRDKQGNPPPPGSNLDYITNAKDDQGNPKYKILNTQEQQKASAANVTGSSLDDLMNFSFPNMNTQGVSEDKRYESSIFPEYSGIMGRSKQAGVNVYDIESQTDRGVALNNYLSKVETLISNLTRIYGQTGVLTDRDVNNVRATLPSIWWPDRPSLAKNKFNDALKLIDAISKRNPATWKKPEGETLIKPMSGASGFSVDMNK